ncbi:MAG: 3'-5' exonuclease [Candidatus Binatia bacterium]|jgi:DNA polymerase III alpha subunit (gram-positive type)
MAASDLCFLDVETSGARFGYHEIIDIGAARTSADASTVQATWQKRVRPRYPKRVTAYARELNGYTPELWEMAEEPTRAFWNDFVSFVGGCVPVGHNPSFDRAFITLGAAEQGVLDLGFDSYYWIGTESLAWPFRQRGLLEDLSLESLCKLFKLEPEPHPHNALDGAMVCLRVYRALMAGLEGS